MRQARNGDGAVAGAIIATALTLYAIFAQRRDRQRAAASGGAPGRDAARPHEIPKAGWWAILKRTWNQLGEDNVSVLAAGVAFYALLSIFPALAALVSVYGLVADPHDVERQLSAMKGVLPPEAVSLLGSQLKGMVQQPSGRFGVGLVVSVLLALWSARAGTGMLMSALNVAYDEREKRNIVWFNLIALGLTAGLIVIGIVAIVCVAGIPAALNLIDLPDPIRSAVAFARWPIIAIIVILALAALYRFGPSREDARWQWVSWGAVTATVLWIVGSVLFSVYVSKFGSYDKTYGSLGAVVVLLMWFYVTAYAILVGAELNAEAEYQTARDTTTGRELPMGARGARMADTAVEPG